jgi:hypothetical protein
MGERKAPQETAIRFGKGNHAVDGGKRKNSC